MTSFAIRDPLADLQRRRAEREARRRRIMDLIGRSRSTNQYTGPERRRKPRLSLDDLEALSESELGQQFSEEPTDNRGPIMRFFDAIDLPRNVVANIVSGLVGGESRQKALEEGERGALGLPRVGFGDILEELGVGDRTARTVLGFVGDVALDPLTYVGGAGVVKLSGQAGRIGLRKGANKALSRAIRDIAAGKAVQATGRIAELDPVLQRLQAIRPRLAGIMQRRGLQGEALEARLRQRLDDVVRGRVRQPTRSSIFGLPIRRPGLLASKVGEESEIGAAVTSFLQREGRSTRPLGELAVHIPFTEVEKRLVDIDPAFRQLRRVDTGAFAGRAADRRAMLDMMVQRHEDVGRRFFKLSQEVIAANILRGSLMQARHVRRPPRVLAALREFNPALFDRVVNGQLDPEEALREAFRFNALPGITRQGLVQAAEEIRRFQRSGISFDLPEETASSIARDVAAEFGIDERAAREAVDFSWLSRDDETTAGVIEGAIRSSGAKLDDRDVRDLARELRQTIDRRLNREARSTISQQRSAIEARIDQIQREVDSLADVMSRTRGEIDLLSRPTFAQVDGRALALAAEVHSPAGLDTGLGLSVLGKASKMIRGSEPEAPAWRKGVADALFRIDDGLQKLFGTGFRGTTLGQAFREPFNLRAAAEATAEAVARPFRNRIESFAARFTDDPETRELINRTIIARLEVGMAAQKDPSGRAIFPAILGDLSSAENIRTAKVRAMELAAKQGLRTPVWDELLDTIADSMDAGLWDNPELRRIADDMASEYAKLDETAVASGLLEKGLPNFAARVPTDSAAEALRRQRQAQPMKYGDPTEASLLATHGFQRHRTTNRFVWTDADGVTHDYYGFELNGDERAQQLVKDAVEAGLVPKHGYQTSAFHVNRMASDQRFIKLLGGSFKEDLFAYDPASALASNYAQIQKAKVGQSFGFYLNNFASAIDEQKLQELVKTGALETVRNGVEYRVLIPGDYGDVGDTVRRLTSISSDNPVAKWIGPGLRNALFDSRVANKIEDMAATFADPDRIGMFLGMLDRVHQYYKVVTLAHPSWYTLNITGNLFASMMAGAKIQHSPLIKTAFDLHGQYARFLKRGLVDTPEFARWMDETVTVGDAVLTRREIIDMAQASGVIEPHREARLLVNGAVSGLFREPNVHDKLLNSRVVQSIWRANHFFEQKQRLFTMLARVAEGDTLETAAKTALQYHYDYGDFTRFERQFLRRLVPFYAWMRSNTPFMIQQTLAQPKWASLFPKLKEAIDEAWDDRNRIPEMYRPDWFNEQLGVQIGKNTGLLLPLLTPIMDVAEVGQSVAAFNKGGFTQMLHWLLSGVSPVVQTPFELASGREFFTGRELGDPDLGKVAPAQFVFEQLRPLREAARAIELFGDPDKTIGHKLEQQMARMFLAGRAQFIDPPRVARQKLFQLSEQAQRIRNRANRAAERGDRLEAVRLSVELQKIWEQMLRLDPETDMVPSNVRQRLAGAARAPNSLPGISTSDL